MSSYHARWWSAKSAMAHSSPAQQFLPFYHSAACRSIASTWRSGWLGCRVWQKMSASSFLSSLLLYVLAEAISSRLLVWFQRFQSRSYSTYCAWKWTVPPSVLWRLGTSALKKCKSSSSSNSEIEQSRKYLLVSGKHFRALKSLRCHESDRVSSIQVWPSSFAD